jgi:ABC-2 type transport system ATP-binding protein
MADAAPLPEAAVAAERLTKRYGSLTAVEDLTFSVAPGEIVGFLGPNGAGKSSTMRILAGTMAGTSGRAAIWGVSVALEPAEAKRHMAYMPENNPLPEDLKVEEYLLLRARLKDVPADRVAARVAKVMEDCDLARRAARQLIGQLSKGFRQRVGIADALLAEPKVVILDEPTIGLDPHQIVGIRDLIRSLRGKMAVLISSHILHEVEQVCDKVVIINRGRLVAQGRPADLRRELIPTANLHRRHARDARRRHPRDARRRTRRARRGARRDRGVDALPPRPPRRVTRPRDARHRPHRGRPAVARDRGGTHRARGYLHRGHTPRPRGAPPPLIMRHFRTLLAHELRAAVLAGGTWVSAALFLALMGAVHCSRCSTGPRPRRRPPRWRRPSSSSGSRSSASCRCSRCAASRRSAGKARWRRCSRPRRARRRSSGRSSRPSGSRGWRSGGVRRLPRAGRATPRHGGRLPAWAIPSCSGVAWPSSP